MKHFPTPEHLTRLRKKVFSKDRVKQRLPFLQWLCNYQLQWGLYDFIAGITVALTVIPQGIAYAPVAGLPLENGLYTALFGPFAYALFGTVQQVTIGPTTVTSVLTRTYTDKGGVLYAAMLSFLSGAAILGSGFMNLGFLIEFVSGPVISGFCNASAVLATIVQLKTLLGLKFKGSSVTEVVYGIFSRIGETRFWDSLLGVCSILTLVFLKYLPVLSRKLGSTSGSKNFINRFLWFVSVSRNASVVFIACVLAFCLELNGDNPFTLTGYVKAGLPSFQVPWKFSNAVVSGDFVVGENVTTYSPDSTLDFPTVLSDFGAGLIMVPLISILEQVAIAKAFAAGKKTDCTQEMIALGVGNFFGSFIGAMPITASFSRSSVQSSSNAQTPFANFFNGCVILLALGFLMPAFSYIPRPVLSAVTITAVCSMIEYDEIIPMWRGRRIELIPFAVTFVCCLFINMEYGILIGTGIHLLIFAYKASRPETRAMHISGQNGMGDEVVIQFDRGLFFPGVEKSRRFIKKSIPRDVNTLVVLDFQRVSELDYTAIKMLKSVVSELRKRNQPYRLDKMNTNVDKSLHSILPSEYLEMKTTDSVETVTVISN